MTRPSYRDTTVPAQDITSLHLERITKLDASKLWRSRESSVFLTDGGKLSTELLTEAFTELSDELSDELPTEFHGTDIVVVILVLQMGQWVISDAIKHGRQHR